VDRPLIWVNVAAGDGNVKERRQTPLTVGVITLGSVTVTIGSGSGNVLGTECGNVETKVR